MPLARLKDHPERMIEAPWRNDPRGWAVVSPDGQPVGRVLDLVFDTTNGDVVAMGIALTRSGKAVLVPAETLSLQGRPLAVKSRLGAMQLAACPPYSPTGSIETAPPRPKRPGSVTLIPEALRERRTPAGEAVCSDLDRPR